MLQCTKLILHRLGRQALAEAIGWRRTCPGGINGSVALTDKMRRGLHGRERLAMGAIPRAKSIIARALCQYLTPLKSVKSLSSELHPALL
jgi:hypothetical protein